MGKPDESRVRFLSGDGPAAPAPTRDLLARLSRPQRVAAIREALRTVSPLEAPGLVLTLLDDANAPSAAPGAGVLGRVSTMLTSAQRRDADDALAALACVWKRVPSELKGAALAVGRGRWTRAIERAAASAEPFERESAAILIRDSGNASNAAEARALLGDEDRDVARAADRALLSLAVRVAGLDAGRLGPNLSFVPIPTRVDDTPAGVVIAQVADAAWAFGESHRGRETLVAALLLADLVTPAPKLDPARRRIDALLNTPDHPAVGALRTIIRTSRSPELRARALRWAGGGPLADAALERLSNADGDDDHGAVLALAHLALRPARMGALTAVPVRTARETGAITRGGVLPSAGEWARLGPAERRGYALLAGAMGLPRPTLRTALAPALGDPDALARHRAARLCDPADLADFTFDVDARVARSACLRWSGAGVGATMRAPRHAGDERRARILSKLSRSPHRAVRAIGAQDRARTDPWDHASPASRVAARRWLHEDRAGFVTGVRERLRSERESERVRAMQLIDAIGAADAFERELVGIAGEPSMRRAAATAARVLGSIDTPGARDALARALRADDARVRANAVEALARQSRGGGGLGVLVEFKSDRHHRVRGAAVRAALSVAGLASLEDVRAMLDDPRAEHRLAGVWVSGRALGGGGELARAGAALVDRLSELATSDPSSQVRARAERCVRRVLVEADYASRGSAGAPEPAGVPA